MNDDIKNIVSDLKENMLIPRFFDDAELVQIIPYFQIVEFAPNATIFRGGDEGKFIGFVVSEKMEVKKQTEFKGRFIILALLGRGSLAGELSMITGQPRTATINAVEDSCLLILKRTPLEDFIHTYPQAGIILLKGVIQTISLRLASIAGRLTKFFQIVHQSRTFKTDTDPQDYRRNYAIHRLPCCDKYLF